MAVEFLNKIVEYKKSVLAQKTQFYDSLKEKLGKEKYTRYELFKRQISKPGQVHLIAEIKKASPSRGVLREDFNLMEIAKIYCENGASAISILTEDKFFLGNPKYIKKVTEQFNLPVLAKDFFIDEGQVYEARFNGASAILLIMAMLDDNQARKLMDVAHQLDLDCLVEIHNEDELKRALDIGAQIIGINNRNLHTFEVDVSLCERLIPRVPSSCIIVAESGLSTAKDVQQVYKLGAHAVLIGETFMKEKDIASKMREVFSKP